tara:strand:- start:1601 stop:2782 length:1182 start_codon:yes stop_codon:yes gene_type:complete
MFDRVVDKKYSHFINTMLFLFVMFVNINRTVGDIILFVLAIIGIYFAIKDRINPLKEERLKIIFFITFGYYLINFIVFIFNGTYIAKYLQTDLYFLLAVFIAISITRAKINLNLVFLGIKIALIILGIGLIFSFQFSNIYISIFAPITALMMFCSILNFDKEGLLEKIIGLVAFAFGLAMIIDSGIRLSWLVFVVLLFIVFNFIFSKNKIIIFPLITALLVLMVFINGDNIVKNRIVIAYDNITQWSQGENRTSSVGIRLEMYKSGIQAFKEKPFFGYGYLRGTKEVSSHVDARARVIVNNFVQLHDEYITTIVEKGLIGLIALLLILFIPFFVFVSNYDRSDIYIRTGIVISVSFILFGTFNVSFGDTTMKAFYVFFLCILLPKFVNERQTK